MPLFSVQSHEPVPPLLIRGGGRKLQLKNHSYQPRALLQRTKELFECEKLLESNQTIHRSKFVNFVKREAKPTQESLQHLMRCLDNFFFSGHLTGGKHRRVTLEFRPDIFDQIGKLEKGEQAVWGLTEVTDKGDTSALKVKISIDASHPKLKRGGIVMRSLIDVLETLVHEMVHAYLRVFVCLCDECQRALGATGHGAVWQELKQVMSMTIRSWDTTLQNFYLDDWDRLDAS